MEKLRLQILEIMLELAASTLDTTNAIGMTRIGPMFQSSIGFGRTLSSSDPASTEATVLPPIFPAFLWQVSPLIFHDFL